jgi:hypothetical protein
MCHRHDQWDIGDVNGHCVILWVVLQKVRSTSKATSLDDTLAEIDLHIIPSAKSGIKYLPALDLFK